MNIMELLEYLQEIIDTAPKVPISSKVMLNKKEALDILEQVINHLPDEFKKAQWIVEEKQRILNDAHKDADEIKKQSEEYIKKQIEKSDITKEAKLRAEEIISSAQQDAKTIRLGARNYADEILSQLEKELNAKGQKVISSLKVEMADYLSKLEGSVKLNVNEIRDNIKELRNYK